MIKEIHEQPASVRAPVPRSDAWERGARGAACGSKALFSDARLERHRSGEHHRLRHRLPRGTHGQGTSSRTLLRLPTDVYYSSRSSATATPCSQRRARSRSSCRSRARPPTPSPRSEPVQGAAHPHPRHRERGGFQSIARECDRTTLATQAGTGDLRRERRRRTPPRSTVLTLLALHIAGRAGDAPGIRVDGVGLRAPALECPSWCGGDAPRETEGRDPGDRGGVSSDMRGSPASSGAARTRAWRYEARAEAQGDRLHPHAGVAPPGR